MQVLIADDHVAITMIASQLATQAFETPEVRVAHTVDDLFSALEQAPADLLVLDLTMPGDLKRIALLREIRSRPRSPQVLVYSADASPCLVAAALENGAGGFITKGEPLTALVEGMKAVARGGRHVDDTIENAGWSHPWRQLTSAERDVLTALVAGRTIKQVAADSRRAYNTVATLRAHGLQKLQLRSHEELAAYFHNQGLGFELDAPLSTVTKLPTEPEPKFSGNVVALRLGNLSAADIETIDVIALMLLGIDDGSQLMEVSTRSRQELLDDFGPAEIAESHAFRFPTWRWNQGGTEWVLIDQGRVRVTISVGAAIRRLS